MQDLRAASWELNFSLKWSELVITFQVLLPSRLIDQSYLDKNQDFHANGPIIAFISKIVYIETLNNIPKFDE